MKIHDINSSSFRGMYRIPNTPKNLAEIDKFVEPMYSRVRHESFFPFVGKSPFKEGIITLMDKIAESTGYPVSWLKMNAENHGADFSELSEEYINVVCGNNDFKTFLDFLKSRTEIPKQSPLEKIKRIFFSQKENTYQEKPEHLRLLFLALDKLKQENEAFNERFKHNIIEVRTPQELLEKMLLEKR